MVLFNLDFLYMCLVYIAPRLNTRRLRCMGKLNYNKFVLIAV